MNTYSKWFGWVVLFGVGINVLLAIPALLFPEWFLSLLGLPIAVPLVWVRFSANLLILLSLFYIPAAIDLRRYQLNAWLAVIARLVGFLFYLTQAHEYLMFGLMDLSFFIPEAILLHLALREQSTNREFNS
ncbi:MAG: hypothetical protein WC856_06980 [Methylococcaceae bacterium]|jgi:hypothetical protein